MIKSLMVWAVFALLIILTDLAGDSLPNPWQTFLFVALIIAMMTYGFFSLSGRNKDRRDPLEELRDLEEVMRAEEDEMPT